MAQAVLTIESLPENALDAAAAFHAMQLEEARAALAGSADALALVFPVAARDHDGWRRALVADLARSAAPKRVNGVTGSDRASLQATIDWLAQAPGITGQMLMVDGTQAAVGAS